MAVINHNPEYSVGSFDLRARVKLNYTDVTVSKWQSRDSGLTVVHLDYNGARYAPYFFSISHFGPFSPLRALMMR